MGLSGYPLHVDPDTLFMRATGLDLGVFGEELDENTSLSMLDASVAREDLEVAVEENPDECADLFVNHVGQRVTTKAILAALESGSWRAGDDATVQAAGFARQLLLATRVADECAVVWEYIGGPVNYGLDE